jgi:hypothetical protein
MIEATTQKKRQSWLTNAEAMGARLFSLKFGALGRF